MSKGKKLFDDFLASVIKNIGVMQISFGEMIIIKTQQSILLDYIAELEAENRWIPVSERLPEKESFDTGQEYLVFNSLLDRVHPAEYIGGDWYSGSRHQWQRETVTHWRPLPQPPEEQE